MWTNSTTTQTLAEKLESSRDSFRPEEVLLGLQRLRRRLARLYELQPGRLRQGNKVDERQEAARGNLQQLEGRR